MVVLLTCQADRYLCAGGGGWPMACSSHRTPQKVTWCLLYRRLSGPQSRYELVWKISSPTRVRTAVCPGSSKSLYQLCYPSCPTQLHLYYNSSHLTYFNCNICVPTLENVSLSLCSQCFKENIVFCYSGKC